MKKFIITLVCLVTTAAIAVAGWFGYAKQKERTDQQMQEQYKAGYDSRDAEIAELEANRTAKETALNAQIADLQEQLANAADPAEIVTLNAQIAELQKQKSELQNEADTLNSIKSGESVVVTFKNDARTYDVQVVAKGSTITEVNPEPTIKNVGYTCTYSINGEEVEISDYVFNNHTTVTSSFNYQDEMAAVPFSGQSIVDICGNNVWTDGNNTYYSDGTKQYVWNLDTRGWSKMTWNGLSSFEGYNVWTDGVDYYYSNRSYQYVLNTATHTWSTMTWNGRTYHVGGKIWTDGINYYSSYNADQYVLEVATHTWSKITWNGLPLKQNYTMFDGDDIWTDGVNYYYSTTNDPVNYENAQYVLDATTHTWLKMTWNGFSAIDGNKVWTDGVNFFYSDADSQYVLDVATHTWLKMTWNVADIRGDAVWTDGVNYYYFPTSGGRYVYESKEQVA